MPHDLPRGHRGFYFLKHLEDLDQIPAIFAEPIFQQAFASAELANLNREQYSRYVQNLLDDWGAISDMGKSPLTRESDRRRSKTLFFLFRGSERS